MRAKVLTHRIPVRELTIVLSLSVFLFYHCFIRPIFAEYISSPVTCGMGAPERAAESPSEKEWNTVESGYFTIYYRPEANLKAIERRLRQRWFYVGESMRPRELSGPAEKIAYRMDILFKRTKDLLGIYPRIAKINVKIFKNRKELQDEYYRIFREKEDLKSFYVYRYNTIYTTEGDISDSVMSHEMAHALVDNYFVVRPPEKIKEMLSTYVDMHLED